MRGPSVHAPPSHFRDLIGHLLKPGSWSAVRATASRAGYSYRHLSGYRPGGVYVTSLRAARSISSGVNRTVVLTLPAPDALTVRESAAILTLSGKSAMPTKSSPPNAK